jgi:flagellar biosynthesis/type III secretory pathway ATPase
MVLKLCIDWLRVNPEVTQCEDAVTMVTQLVHLLNILPKQDELWRIGEYQAGLDKC